jgi:hypothetical protein
MKKIFSLLAFCLGFLGAIAQDTTEVAAVEEAPKAKFARATFNATKLINMQTTEIVSPGALQFMISHHFSHIWNKDGGSQNFAQMLGLNSGVAHTYLSFDYSPTTYLNLGLAAAGSSQFEGWVKARLLRQQTGIKNIPVSLTLYTMAHANAAEDPEKSFIGNKFSYLTQLLIARKMSDKLSLQLAPTWIHYNIVPSGVNNSNEVFSLGLGGKYKVKGNMNVTFEYSRQFNMYENLITKNGAIINYNPDLLSVGIEINTGGHLFQFYAGSTTDASLIDQLSRNNSSIKDGNFALGFTINRSMNVKKEK